MCVGRSRRRIAATREVSAVDSAVRVRGAEVAAPGGGGMHHESRGQVVVGVGVVEVPRGANEVLRETREDEACSRGGKNISVVNRVVWETREDEAGSRSRKNSVGVSRVVLPLREGDGVES